MTGKRFTSLLLALLMAVTVTACGEKAPEPEPVPEEPSVETLAPVEPEPAPVQDDTQLAAVIAAAIAAIWQDENTGFVVRRIRRVNNASAWQRAGREEQIYSRL